MSTPSENSPAPKLEIVSTVSGYDRWSSLYDQHDNPLVLLDQKHIGRLIGDVAGLTVIDVGCGTGRHSVRLAAAGARVTAVDFSEGMLQVARTKPGAEGINFLQHDITQPLPLAAESFDRVFCFLVLDHIPDVDAFFRELSRLCRPGGQLVISAMHPAMELRGVQARFTDPTSGQKVGPKSYSHQVSDYVMAALRVGLELDQLSEHAVDAALASTSESAAKYLDWPMLLLMRLKKAKHS